MKDLGDIKEGDKVVYINALAPERVLEVTKVTKTLIICGRTRFNKQTGRITGAAIWNTAYIHYPEDGEIEAIRQQQIVQSIVHKLQILDPVNITYEQAIKVKEILNW